MAGGAGSDFWVMEGVPLKPELAKIYDMPERRIEIPRYSSGTASISCSCWQVTSHPRQ
jgi:hypothetical protein